MNTLPKSERILIVGGTSGIGAAVAERLSARYAITIASRRLMKYPHFDQLAFDASDPGSIRAALGDSIFDHVVVTAADTPTGPLKDLSDISVHRAIQNKLVLNYMVLREIRAVRSVTLTSGYLSARPGKATALQSALNFKHRVPHEGCCSGTLSCSSELCLSRNCEQFYVGPATGTSTAQSP